MSSQMNSLAKALSKLAVQQPAKKKKTSKRRTRKRRANNSKSTPGTLGTSSSVQQGTINFSRLEYLAAVKGVDSFNLEPGSFPFLKSLSASFEHYRWIKMKILYKPMVGANTSGAVTIGVDWSNVATKTDRAGVTSLTPMFDVPVWQTGQITLPASRLQSRKFYIIDASDVNDKQPCKVFWATSLASATIVGDLWVDYSIQMFGTK